MMRFMMRWILVSLLAVAMLSSSLASAQSNEKAAARALAVEGLEHYKAERFDEALDRFRRAHALAGVPTTGLWKARSLEKVGRWVEASEIYLKVAETAIAADTDKRWIDAIGAARTDRAALLPRIPRLKISLTGDGADVAKVSIDGHSLPAALVGVAQPVDPGNHLVIAEHADDKVEQRIELASGDNKVVELRIAARTSAAHALWLAPDAAGGSIGHWVAFGIAGAAGIGAAIVGGLTLKEESRLEVVCPNSKCESSLEFATYDTLRVASFGLVGLAGAAAISGVVLLAVGGSDEKPQPDTAGSWTPVVAPHFVGVQGSF
jgi:tetratricopeptide (TPR) repeat protein